MKNVSTAAAKQSRNFSELRLTIGQSGSRIITVGYSGAFPSKKSPSTEEATKLLNQTQLA